MALSKDFDSDLKIASATWCGSSPCSVGYEDYMQLHLQKIEKILLEAVC